ncbi:MAG: PASTA domain-containing protein [Methanosarcinales archaeon]|nr:PASTA domain-containing protein [Methanosarcinales archaeon]
MTTSNLMSLPIDIPWKWLATSRDMMDVTYGDRKYPPRWRSSVTIFSYEPPNDQQQLEGSTITYLKISCSITGLENPLTKDPKSVSIDPKLLAKHWAFDYWKTRNKKITEYYPCHGALLQVAVFPNEVGVELENYPVILDFEPKRREMYTTSVEQTQVMSQSRSNIEVRKGTTTTVSQEVRWGFGGSISARDDGVGFGAGGGFSSKSGFSTQDVSMLTVDLSREKRENYSYVSNLNHMYHLLNSYHLGTNRALFFLQPRPYITDAEFSFVNGLRKLEGIQDFFLIVQRPKDIGGLCIEATLETAHLQRTRSYKAKVISKTQLSQGNNITKTGGALGLSPGERDANAETLVHGGTLGNTKYPGWNNISSVIRSLIVFYLTLPGYSYDNSNKIQKDKGHPSIKRIDWENIEGILKLAPNLNPVEDSAVIYESSQSDSGTLFVTGRTTATCDPLIAKLGGVWLVYETPSPWCDLQPNAVSANQAMKSIGSLLESSVVLADRFEYGEATFEEASFVQGPLLEALSKIPEDDRYNIDIEEIESLPLEISLQLKEVFGVKKRNEALGIELYQLRSGLGLTEAEARRLRTQLIGKGPRLEVQPGAIIVPNIEGMSLEEARKLLNRSRLTTSDKVTYKDALEPRDAVLNQFPNAGTAIKKGEVVSLVVSSGPVAVPDVIGLNVDEATVRLEELSLRVEKSFAVSDKQPEDHVLETTPSANTEVIRNSQVVLLIARKA